MQRIFLLLVLSIVFMSCNDNEESVKTKFGIEKNADRVPLHLVAVDPGTKIEEDISLEGRRFIFVNQREAGISSPAYLRKIIVLDSARNAISTEEDYFKNPGESKYLVTTHRYYSGETTITLQADGGSILVSKEQADSILRAWSIKQNPFSGQ